jgi:hypothetical protein
MCLEDHAMTSLRFRSSCVRLVLAVGLLLPAVAWASGLALVSPSEPHAVISVAQPSRVETYALRMVTLDGRLLPDHLHRLAYWIRPGRHTVGFMALMNNAFGPGFAASGVGGSENWPTVTMDFKAGRTYYFGAKIVHDRAYRWKPVVVLVRKNRR